MVSETSKTCATGATCEDEISNPSRFSRKSRANNEIRFTSDVPSLRLCYRLLFPASCLAPSSNAICSSNSPFIVHHSTLEFRPARGPLGVLMKGRDICRVLRQTCACLIFVRRPPPTPAAALLVQACL